MCRSCGEVNPERARYCLACGRPLPAAAPSAVGESRKTVTVVFCDVVGSTPLGEQLDPESLRRVMTRFFERTSRALERHGGTVSKYIGDAVMAVFGIPTLHEDDALRAVRAASEMRAEISALNEELRRDVGVELRVRIGVNTGPAVVGDPALGDALVVGDAVNVAARLEQAAAPDEIVLGPDTYALVRAFVTVDDGTALMLKGKAEPVRGFRLVDVDPDPGRQDRLRPAFVGRADELAAIASTFERTVRDRTCVLLSVLGVAGIGSRGSSTSSARPAPTTLGSSPDGACPTATASRSGRSPRSSRTRAGSPMPTRATTRSRRCAAPSPRRPTPSSSPRRSPP